MRMKKFKEQFGIVVQKREPNFAQGTNWSEIWRQKTEKNILCAGRMKMASKEQYALLKKECSR